VDDVDLRDDLRDRLGRLRFVGHVGDTDSEVLAKTAGWPTGTGQAHGLGCGENLANLPGRPGSAHRR
jgi:hypothetical protein